MIIKVERSNKRQERDGREGKREGGGSNRRGGGEEEGGSTCRTAGLGRLYQARPIRRG